MIVNVLGTDYTIEIKLKKDDAKLENLDGYCDYTTKKIVCVDFDDEYKSDPLASRNLEIPKNNTLKHELVHAFIYESGLSGEVSWTYSEELVDWIALQFGKMYKAFESIGVI